MDHLVVFFSPSQSKPRKSHFLLPSRGAEPVHVESLSAVQLARARRVKPIVISGCVGMTAAVLIHPSPDWPPRPTSGYEIISPSACFQPARQAVVGLSILSICLPAHNRIRAAAWRQSVSFPFCKLHARNRTTCSACHYHL